MGDGGGGGGGGSVIPKSAFGKRILRINIFSYLLWVLLLCCIVDDYGTFLHN